MKSSQKNVSLSWVWILGAAILFFAVATWKGNFSKIDFPETDLPVLAKIPDFKLTERSGEIITRKDLANKISVVNFIFTRCAGPCPLLSGYMRGLQNEFRDNTNIQFVSFTVDPDYDKPSVLKKYAQKYQADKDKWWFLTGEKGKIYELSNQHFYLGIVEEPDAEEGMAITHSTRFALLDSKQQIRGYYDTEEAEGLRNLKRDVRRLLGADDEHGS